MKDSPHLMIWLHPDAATRERIEAAALYLRKVAGDELPAVPLHLTLASGSHGAPDVDASLRRVASTFAPLRLTRDGAVHHPDPSEAGFRIWTSLYLPIERSPALRALRAACHDAFGLETSPAPFAPHVSLAYSTRSKRAKAAWLDTLRTLGGSITESGELLRFDALSVRRDVPHDDTAERMRSWEVLAGERLTGER